MDQPLNNWELAFVTGILLWGLIEIGIIYKHDRQIEKLRAYMDLDKLKNFVRESSKPEESKPLVEPKPFMPLERVKEGPHKGQFLPRKK